MYPWILVSVFTLLSVIDHHPCTTRAVTSFRSFELLLDRLKETAVRLEAQNSLAESFGKPERRNLS